MSEPETISDLAKEVTAYVAQLQAENAKLREVIEDLEECDQIHRTMLKQVTELKAKAKAENAKLRELVADAHSCKTNEGCCEDCYRDEGCCPIERRMHELEIGVGA